MRLTALLCRWQCSYSACAGTLADMIPLLPRSSKPAWAGRTVGGHDRSIHRCGWPACMLFCHRLATLLCPFSPKSCPQALYFDRWQRNGYKIKAVQKPGFKSTVKSKQRMNARKAATARKAAEAEQEPYMLSQPHNNNYTWYTIGIKTFQPQHTMPCMQI